MIRRAQASQLSLMRGLARFEGYDDRFVVMPRALIERGFSPHRPPEFTAWVAELDRARRLCGDLRDSLPFDLRPTVVLKELLERAARGKNFGTAVGCGDRAGAFLPNGCGLIHGAAPDRFGRILVRAWRWTPPPVWFLGWRDARSCASGCARRLWPTKRAR